VELHRGDIYRVKIKMFFDKYISKGKYKYVLVLQEGEYFSSFPSVQVLLITSDKGDKSHDEYNTDVEIEIGSTNLPLKSWALCAQLYPLKKSIFEEDDVIYAGQLSPEKMIEIDEAIYDGICMNLENELEKKDPLVDNVGLVVGAAIVGGVIGAGVVTYFNKINNKTNKNNDVIINKSRDELTEERLRYKK
jgi:mRNA-degrading endonuclease toxin of MazEF toxin-antitoxin module